MNAECIIQIENQWSYSTAGALSPRGEWFICSVKVKTYSLATITLMGLNGKELTVSSENQPPTNDTDFTSLEYPPLSDVLESHLTGCSQCQESLSQKPVPNMNPGGKTPLCPEWFKILRKYAEMEGSVNNIVRHDEYGNYAHGSKGEL